MAKLTSLFQFSGSLDGISVYTMEGVKHPIVRRKGGPSREKLKTAPSCANNRRTSCEFGGRSLASGLIRVAWLSVSTIIDNSCMGRINKVLTHLQAMDSRSAWESGRYCFHNDHSFWKTLNWRVLGHLMRW